LWLLIFELIHEVVDAVTVIFLASIDSSGVAHVKKLGLRKLQLEAFSLVV
jgi:hypothetical protein